VKRQLLPSPSFLRAARRTVKKQPQIAAELQTILELLSEDAFHPQLRTHKLKGKLEGSWACSAGYDLRILFSFVQIEGAEALLLEAIGTHEEVY
jgi:addiction module RelE/StbE family toxin